MKCSEIVTHNYCAIMLNLKQQISITTSILMQNDIAENVLSHKFENKICFHSSFNINWVY